MGDGTTAADRLDRLLHLLPSAMRDDGVSLDALAGSLETTPERIMEDINELTDRAYYRPGGWPDDVQIFIEDDRVEVFRADGFERPVRLNRDETLCLAIALRGGVASAHLADEGERRALLERAERHLGRPVPEGDVDSGASGFEAAEREPDIDGVRELLITARAERRPCALWYAKAGAEDGSVRVVHPYAVCHGEGGWYAVAFCTVQQGIRVFRLDRVLACDVTDGSFTVPADFDPAEYARDGRVFYARPDQDVLEVRVRYSSAIARWVRERARWGPDRLEENGDGSVVLRHAVVDPQWAVEHALQYGADAEIVEPASVRGLLRDAVGGLGR